MRNLRSNPAHRRYGNSECVISINKNDTAAIFDVSDLGIVGDVKVIIPKLIDALTKYKLLRTSI